MFGGGQCWVCDGFGGCCLLMESRLEEGGGC